MATQAARAAMDRKSREHVENEKLIHDRMEKMKDRAHDEWKTKVKSETDIRAAKIKAIGQVGASAVKMYGKKNDPEWYKSYIKDLDIFTKVPTYDRLGTVKFGDRYGRYADKKDLGVPGILVFKWISTVGPQRRNNTHWINPVNQSLARFKEKVLALNSRSNVSWEFADLGFNLFCSADIMGHILELGRVIKVYQTYKSKNAYLAKALIEALGWSFADIVANFSDYRKVYTMLARKFNSAIIAPGEVTLYKRRRFLAENIFIDQEDTENPRQMYAYVESHGLVLAQDETFCNCHDMTTYRLSITSFETRISSMIARITDSPDFIEMYQDLRHALGDNLVQIPESVENEEIQFNNVALNREQIHNLMVAPAIITDADTFVRPNIGSVNGFDLRQDTDGYLYQADSRDTHVRSRLLPYGATHVTGASAIAMETWRNLMDGVIDAFYGANGKFLCNMHKTDISGDDIIDITRGLYSLDAVRDDSNNLNLVVYNCGTEVVHNSDFYYYAADETMSLEVDLYFTPFSSLFVCPPQFGGFYVPFGPISAFDWHPISRAVVGYGISGSFTIQTMMDAFTTFEISYDTLYDIHSPCVMGELYCADTGFVR